MREKLNDNPLAQVALIGVLLLAVGFFVMSSMGGGGDEEESSGGEVAATVNGVPATGSTPGEAVDNAVASLESGATTSGAPPAPIATKAPPSAVVAAYESGATVALLFVHDGGIDDRLVRDASTSLSGLPGVASFVVPAARISRYAAITEGVGVDRVPALVVIRPKRDGSVPTASVSYGFQTGESVVQAVIDAGYDGPTVDYHP